MNEKQSNLLPIESIQSKIFVIRGKKVLLDRHLAELYGVTTKNLNKAVGRNIERFPEDFMFQLNKHETDSLRFQFGTLKGRGQHIKYLPYAFTENGVAMLSSVLRSPKAIQVNIEIMRVFTRLREFLLTHKDLKRKIETLERKYKNHDLKINAIVGVIDELLDPPLDQKKKQNKIGFISE